MVEQEPQSIPRTKTERPPRWVVFLFWCEEWDLNPHVVRHTHLKRACLPIPASSHINVAIIAPEITDVNGFFAENSAKNRNAKISLNT